MNIRDAAKLTNSEAMARVYAEAYQAHIAKSTGHASATRLARAAVNDYLGMLEEIHENQEIV